LTAFDNIAASYDDDFVNSPIGRAQRDIVWACLKKVIDSQDQLRILELNCGSGEDAIWLAGLGHHVVATDISTGMLEIANRKKAGRNVRGTVEFRKMDMKDLDNSGFNIPFDLVFSNFGGLNCLGQEEVRQLFRSISAMLTKNGRFIAVVMPSFCLWESFYFMVKGKVGQAFRRRGKKAVMVEFNGEGVRTWYYSPGMLKRLADSSFVVKGFCPVGFAVPPGYLNTFFAFRMKTLNMLYNVEKKVPKRRWAAAVSDHYLVDFKRKT
jgi:ubiquinone/menaquinone biosynthesis C-methylase UbiE